MAWFGKFSPQQDRLVGLVAKASTSGVEDPGFEFRLRRDFSKSSHTSDLKIETPVANLLDGLVVKATASRAEDPICSNPDGDGIFPGRVIPVT